jgi:hypothetical protein
VSKSIIIQTLTNEQPMHVFVQHHGVKESKIADLFHEVVQEQYDRLERGHPVEYLLDMQGPHGVIMSRGYVGGTVTTVHIFVADSQEAKPYYDGQVERKTQSVQ